MQTHSRSKEEAPELVRRATRLGADACRHTAGLKGSHQSVATKPKKRKRNRKKQVGRVGLKGSGTQKLLNLG